MLARRIGVALSLSLALAAPAFAAPSGTVIITDHQMDPTSKTFEADLKKAQQAAIEKSGDTWKIYFVAFLKKAAGSPQVNIVFYEGSGSKREEINAFPIETKADAKILMSSVEINPDNGFKPGHKYQVLITRLVGGHEDVYAKTQVELK